MKSDQPSYMKQQQQQQSCSIAAHFQEANQPGSAPSHRRRGSSPAGRPAAAQTTSPPHVWTAPGWRHLETTPAHLASGACSCAPPPSKGQRESDSLCHLSAVNVKLQHALFFFYFIQTHCASAALFCARNVKSCCQCPSGLLQFTGQSQWMERIMCQDSEINCCAVK